MKGETILERMRKGQPIGRSDPEIAVLDEALDEGDRLRTEYNSSGLTRSERKALLEKILHAPVKGETKVVPPFHFDFGFNIRLGKDDIINYDVVMLDDAEIDIGDNVLIGPGAKLVTASHPLDAETRRENPFMSYAQPIRICDNVWIGAGAIILPGITVGEGAVVRKAIIAENTVIGKNAKLGEGNFEVSRLDPKVYNSDLVVIGASSVIPEGVSIGKNTAISGVTGPEDYPDGALASGGYILKKEGKR